MPWPIKVANHYNVKLEILDKDNSKKGLFSVALQCYNESKVVWTKIKLFLMQNLTLQDPGPQPRTYEKNYKVL